MSMREERRALKREVRAAIRETHPWPAWITLLNVMVVGAGSAVIDWAMRQMGGAMGTLGGMTELFGWNAELALERLMFQLTPAAMLRILLSALLAGLLSGLWSALMGACYQDYCLAVARREHPGAGRLFRIWSSGSVIKRVLLAQIWVFLLTSLWTLLLTLGLGLGCLAAILLSEASELLGSLLLLLLSLAFVVGLIWVLLRYAFTNFLILDDPDIGPRQAVRESVALLRGRVGQLFVLQLSFLGWYLLMLLPMLMATGIWAAVVAAQPQPDFRVLMVGPLVLMLSCIPALVGSLFLSPYIGASNAHFYDLTRGAVPVRLPPWDDSACPTGGGASGHSDTPWQPPYE